MVCREVRSGQRTSARAGFRDQERHELLDRWGLYDPAGIEQRKAAGRAAFVRQDLDELSPRELACDRELIGLREASAGPRQRDRAEHVTLDPQRHLRRELDAIGELPWHLVNQRPPASNQELAMTTLTNSVHVSRRT